MSNPPAQAPDDAPKPGLAITIEPYDADGVQWLVTQAEAELVERYGQLAESEQGLGTQEFNLPFGAFVLARDGAEGQVIGGVGLRVVGSSTGEIKRLWVDPGWRGRGIGRIIMVQAEAVGLALGLSRLRLSTGWLQPEAIALYESAGWTRLDLTFDGEPIPDGWVLFSKDLPSASQA
jgi:ribosomal protein S18 acetylase RimI-like enzyme